MNKILSIILLFAPHAYAQNPEECLDRAIRFSLMFKVKDAFQSGQSPLMKELKFEDGDPHPMENPKISAKQYCDHVEAQKIQEVEATKKRLLKTKSLILKQFASGGKVSDVFVNGLLSFDATKKSMTPHELCEEINKEIARFSSDGLSGNDCLKKKSKDQWDWISKYDVASKSFPEACEAFGTNFKAFIISSNNCQTLNGPEKTATLEEKPENSTVEQTPKPQIHLKKVDKPQESQFESISIGGGSTGGRRGNRQ